MHDVRHYCGSEVIFSGDQFKGVILVELDDLFICVEYSVVGFFLGGFTVDEGLEGLESRFLLVAMKSFHGFMDYGQQHHSKRVRVIVNLWACNSLSHHPDNPFELAFKVFRD